SVRLLAAQTLMQVGPEEKKAAVAVLLELLREADPDIRSQVVNMVGLAAVEPEAAAQAFVALLKDPERALRVRATFLVRQLNPVARKVAVPALTALLKDKDANVRLDAVQLLRDLNAIDAKTAAAVLVEALHDPQPP